MSDYIRREDAVDRMNHYGSIWMEYTEAMSKHEVAEQALKASKQAVIDVLENLPSADVAQVVHGRWTHKPNVYGVAYCSECDYELRINNASYCPNCGAKMDGERKE